MDSRATSRAFGHWGFRCSLLVTTHTSYAPSRQFWKNFSRFLFLPPRRQVVVPNDCGEIRFSWGGLHSRNQPLDFLGLLAQVITVVEIPWMRLLASRIGSSSPPSVLRVRLASTSSWRSSSALRWLLLPCIELSLPSADRWQPSLDADASPASLALYPHFLATLSSAFRRFLISLPMDMTF